MSSTSPSPGSVNVLVVGAGPVGLTAASELTRHGAHVRIVDRRAGPVEYSQAAAVHVRMQEILGAMGIVGGWLAAGHPMDRLHVRAFGKKIGAVRPGGIDSPYPTPLIVGQDVTERLLVAGLERQGVRVERHVEAVRFSQDSGGASVVLHHLADGNREETVRVPWVVACEGSSSKAREAMGIPFDGARYTGTEFVQADVRVHWAHPDGDAYSFIENDRTLVLFPFDGAGRYRVLCARPESSAEPAGHPTLEEMQTIAREIVGDPALRLTDPLWLSRFRTQHRLAGRFREGRIFLAGDSGHVHVPIGGQGMNYGIQDAFNLGWKLATVVRGDAHPEPLLDSYNVERHTVDADLLHGTDQGFHAMVRPGKYKRFAIRRLGPVALASEQVQQHARTLLAGTRVSYSGSPAVRDRGGSDGPAAGDHAPDAAVVRLVEQETVRLFELFYPTTRWTLLLFGGLDPIEPTCWKLAQAGQAVLTDFGHLVNAHFVLTNLGLARNIEGGSVLLDLEDAAHDKYGAKKACIYLIRPDGYVGFRGGPDSVGELTAYLYRIGLVKMG